jgi:hypothetical protein
VIGDVPEACRTYCGNIAPSWAFVRRPPLCFKSHVPSPRAGREPGRSSILSWGGVRECASLAFKQGRTLGDGDEHKTAEAIGPNRASCSLQGTSH